MIRQCSVNGGDGERFLSKTFSNLCLTILTEGGVKTEAGSLISKWPSLSIGSGSYLGVPCRVNIQKIRKYQVSPTP